MSDCEGDPADKIKRGQQLISGRFLGKKAAEVQKAQISFFV